MTRLLQKPGICGIGLLAASVPAYADPGLGGLAALQNFLLGVMFVFVIGLILLVPGAIKARRMQLAGDTERRLYRFIRGASWTYLAMLSPVVMFLIWNPQLGWFAFIPLLLLAGIYGSVIHVFRQG